MVCNARDPETEIEFDGKVFLSPDVIPGNVQVVTSGKNAPVRNLRFRTRGIFRYPKYPIPIPGDFLI